MQQQISHRQIRHLNARPSARRQHRIYSRVSAAATDSVIAGTRTKLLYDGVVFDMDGTLTQAHIDFVDMRKRTGIPVGDLFVAMESWEEPERIKASMDVILEIEAEAAKGVQGKEGLMELLQMLSTSDVKVALVTRNTHNSVAAFFDLIGEEWVKLFSEVRTREFQYVKPDKRLLLDVAQSWGLQPGKLLMVGDSLEDVECGNAAGTATCLVAGGGNEVGGNNTAPPPGAVPTFSVSSLTELRQFLLETAPGGGDTSMDASSSSSSSNGSEKVVGSVEELDSSRMQLLGWRLQSSSESDDEHDSDAVDPVPHPSSPGAPAPGLDFVDWLVDNAALVTASCSFPRMGAAAGGLQACALGGGNTVIHVGMGDGSLTKMMASKGLCVMGVDADVAAGVKRGLRCVQYSGAALAAGSLSAAAEDAGGPVDAVLLYTAAHHAHEGLSSSDCLTDEALQEYRGLLKPNGRLCVEVPVSSDGSQTADAAVIGAALEAAGYKVMALELLMMAQQRLRLVAQKC